MMGWPAGGAIGRSLAALTRVMLVVGRPTGNAGRAEGVAPTVSLEKFPQLSEREEEGAAAGEGRCPSTLVMLSVTLQSPVEQHSLLNQCCIRRHAGVSGLCSDS